MIKGGGFVGEKKSAKQKVTESAKIAGTVYGNVSNASTIYGEEKFHASRGHGFAEERANTLHDKITSKQ